MAVPGGWSRRRSFARWLCGATSPGGRVLAVDADPRHLVDLPDRGGEVAQIGLG
jgi:hypothetical protein